MERPLAHFLKDAEPEKTLGATRGNADVPQGVEEHAAVGDDSVGLVEAAVEEEEEDDEEEEVFHPGDTSGLLRRFDSAVSAVMEAEPGGVDDYITPMTNRPQVRNPKVVLFFVVGPHTTRGRCLGRHLRLHGWRSTSLAVGKKSGLRFPQDVSVGLGCGCCC